jgi:hypothetical protein
MNAQLTFNFAIGHYNGTMSLKAVSGKKVLIDKKTFEDKEFSFSTEIAWPDPVVFIIENKGPNDTLVDELGNVSMDKFIKLESMIVDRMPVHIIALLDCVSLTTDTQVLKTNYWGFNGVATVLFDRNDTLSWHLNNAIKVTGHNKIKKQVVTDHSDNAGLGTIY